jgi:sporulation protein YlmC with PRC-barrel domain
MLRSLKHLERYKVTATDGDIGRVENFLLDDARWTVRYLVVATGGFLDGRQVLITPISFHDVDFPAERFRLSISRSKVIGSPPRSADLPVSQQYEQDYYSYYGYASYAAPGGLWGTGGHPAALASGSYHAPGEQLREPLFDVHLRSARELTGYHLEAVDGSIGHVKDFVVDDETWQIRYLIIATTNWWPGTTVLIAPEWASRASWTQGTMHLGMTREAIKSSPQWNDAYPIERSYEEQLYRHYSGVQGWPGRPPSFPRESAGEEDVPPGSRAYAQRH